MVVTPPALGGPDAGGAKPFDKELPAQDPWVQYLEGDPWDDCRDLVQASLVDWRDDFLRLQRVQASAKAAQVLLKAHQKSPLATESHDKPAIRHFEALSLPGTSVTLSQYAAAIEEEDAKGSLAPASLASLSTQYSTSPSSPSMQIRSVSPSLRMPSHRAAMNSGHSSSASPSNDIGSVSPTLRRLFTGSPIQRRNSRRGFWPQECSPERMKSAEGEREAVKARSLGPTRVSAVLAPVSERLDVGGSSSVNGTDQQEQRPACLPANADMQQKQAASRLLEAFSQAPTSPNHKWRSMTAPTSPLIDFRRTKLRGGMASGNAGVVADALHHKDATSGYPAQMPKTSFTPPRTAAFLPTGSRVKDVGQSRQSHQSPLLLSRPCGVNDSMACPSLGRRQSSLNNPLDVQVPRGHSSPSNPPTLQVPLLAGVSSCVDAPRSTEEEMRANATSTPQGTDRDAHQELQSRLTVPTINTADRPSQAVGMNSFSGNIRSPTMQIRSLALEKSVDLKAAETAGSSVRSTTDTSRSSTTFQQQHQRQLQLQQKATEIGGSASRLIAAQQQLQQLQQLHKQRCHEKPVLQKAAGSGGSSVRSDAGAPRSSAAQQQQQQPRQQEQQRQQPHSTKFVRVGFLVPDW